MECETKSIATTKDLKSNQITKKEEATETLHLKIDLANSRTASAEKPEWEEAKIIDGVAVIDEKRTSNGFTSTMKATMQIVPSGRIMADNLFTNDTTSETFKARGMCKAVDESVFEKALNQ